MDSSGFESQINEFLEKFKQQSSARVIDDDFVFDSSGRVLRTEGNMEYDGIEIEMTGK